MGRFVPSIQWIGTNISAVLLFVTIFVTREPIKELTHISFHRMMRKKTDTKIVRNGLQ